MSSVVIAGDTSGSITVSAPAVAGSNTLTLPAATGTVIYADGSGNLQANSGYGSVATGYLCRAWVNFNGTGTVAIRASGNVTSVTDNGTGDYGINFTTAMPDTNYSASGFAKEFDGTTNSWSYVNFARKTIANTLQTTNLQIVTQATGGATLLDCPVVTVQVFR